ncbi:circularly permuted type 2 ATP-grasp protein [Propionibacterium cyclohexanicum]|nr:circularly permuted type 2 ATP-grasp protein [Propionibacterium cyclohexanicum]
MSSLLSGYPVAEKTFDEMVGPEGVRELYGELAKGFDEQGADEVRQRAGYLASRYLDTGVTFDFSGQEEPFPVDIVPRIIDVAQWGHIESGLKQRVRVLEHFLADVYGPGKIFDDGVMPRALVTTSAHFVRAISGQTPVNGVRIHVAGIDCIRDGQGVWRILEDNVRIPSGVSYVLTNRQATAAALPEVMGRYGVRRVDDYPARLRAALVKAAPAGVPDPNIVVLTPGVHNSAYFEHTLLARTMGVPLVEGRDLVARHGTVYLRTTDGLQRVDVIYRRVDDDFLDPVQFRTDSVLGCAGLLSAQANGNVTIANSIGNGVADDKLVYSYVPDMIRYYLHEDPILPNVRTWRLEEPEHLAEVVDRLDELVVKPVDGSGGKGIVIGPQCSRREIDAVRTKVLESPRGWIAQPLVQLSTVPTMADGVLRPRHVDLRPFVVNDGEDMWVLPGGLTRVALKEGQFIVNSSQGGGSKDTWVLNADAWGNEPVPAESHEERAPGQPEVSHSDEAPDEAEHQQQQQQQQQQVRTEVGAP